MANTKEQQFAIDKEGTNIIVSAGAGSGKTAVLTQRVIRKIFDGVNVNELLVLTFTNEAAAEMKSRIRDEIIKNNLAEQLSLLDSSYITTFDSFALSLVKKYSYLLNIDKNIGIVDSNIIDILKYKIIDNIFEDMYGDDKFNQLINEFCIKDDKNLKNDIIKLSNKLDLELNKEEYINNYVSQYYEEKFINERISEYLNIIKYKISELKEIYQELINYCSDSLIQKLDVYLKNLYEGSTYDEYICFLSASAIRFVGIEESGKEIRDLFKKKVDEIKELLRFNSIDELKETYYATKQNLEVILDIVKKLDEEINKYKDKYGCYEFNDIAHMAISIVRDNDDICGEVKKSFNEIMVDEYQDTSNIQEEFVNLISNNNVYMVGDVKQSIYRFRNANPYIFQEKYNKYSINDGGIKIDLLKNFRSRNETLFNINEIFNIIMDDEIGNANYLESHNMVYGNTKYDDEETGHDNNLLIYNYDNDINLDYKKEEKELFIISEDIQEKINNGYMVFDKKTSKLRRLKYSDICIITDRNLYLEKYKKILEYSGIPSVIYMDQELTNNNNLLVIKNLIQLVSYVNNDIFDIKFKYLFTSVARSFIFEYTDDQIYDILTNKKYFDDTIVKLAKMINISNPLENILNDIFDKFNIYEKLTNLSNIEEYLIRINNLLDISSNLSGLGYNLGQFVEYIDEVMEKGLKVKYSVNTNVDNAVKIMNIHKSKGLEFSLCYFTGMHNKFTIKELNDKILVSNRLGIILPYYLDEEKKLKPHFLYDIFRDNFFKEEISEKIRLFYVALTRCREKMIIVTSLDKERNGFNRLVPISKRLMYRSFLDILNSTDVINKYVIDKEANYTHDYDLIKLNDLQITNNNEQVIEKREIINNAGILNELHFSKETNKILDKEVILMMKKGTQLHEKLEYANFLQKDNPYIKNLFDMIDDDYINIYREYEFLYTKDNEKYSGVIDLMLEYKDYINIIDYKLKNIEDENYIKQLNGYKDYISSISSKPVYIYLYSLLDNKIKKID